MNNQHFLPAVMATAVLAGLAVLAGGCSSGTTSNGGSTQGSDASTADLNTSKCGKFDDGTYGKKVPWQGYTAEGTLLSCNVCRGGYQNLNGSWRFIDFKTEDPATPVDPELLTFDGNTYTDRIRGDDGGKQVEQTSNGWYFCGDNVEIPSMDSIFVIEKATPDGAFGNHAGSFWRASVKTNGNDLIALGLSEGLTGNIIGEYLYCRVGSTINGHPCTDPFAK
ncbi:MAG: hypothetical protein HY902_17460 [Deltaproteobacteria bacterium]|nr:hypothetical protein [Deltaproteobacteria bacterium]